MNARPPLSPSRPLRTVWTVWSTEPEKYQARRGPGPGSPLSRGPSAPRGARAPLHAKTPPKTAPFGPRKGPQGPKRGPFLGARCRGDAHQHRQAVAEGPSSRRHPAAAALPRARAPVTAAVAGAWAAGCRSVASRARACAPAARARGSAPEPHVHITPAGVQRHPIQQV
eukprot:scaffold4124_cov378-Prasinococcus_capsulatus_cf.AAC.6